MKTKSFHIVKGLSERKSWQTPPFFVGTAAFEIWSIVLNGQLDKSPLSVENMSISQLLIGDGGIYSLIPSWRARFNLLPPKLRRRRNLPYLLLLADWGNWLLRRMLRQGPSLSRFWMFYRFCRCLSVTDGLSELFAIFREVKREGLVWGGSSAATEVPTSTTSTATSITTTCLATIHLQTTWNVIMNDVSNELQILECKHQGFQRASRQERWMSEKCKPAFWSSYR